MHHSPFLIPSFKSSFITNKTVGEDIFDKETTLFIDASEAVLAGAQEYGIRYILYKSYASSKADKGTSPNFPAIDDFGHLMFLDRK